MIRDAPLTKMTEAFLTYRFGRRSRDRADIAAFGQSHRNSSYIRYRQTKPNLLIATTDEAYKFIEPILGKPHGEEKNGEYQYPYWELD